MCRRCFSIFSVICSVGLSFAARSASAGILPQFKSLLAIGIPQMVCIPYHGFSPMGGAGTLLRDFVSCPWWLSLTPFMSRWLLLVQRSFDDRRAHRSIQNADPRSKFVPPSVDQQTSDHLLLLSYPSIARGGWFQSKLQGMVPFMTPSDRTASCSTFLAPFLLHALFFMAANPQLFCFFREVYHVISNRPIVGCVPLFFSSKHQLATADHHEPSWNS